MIEIVWHGRGGQGAFTGARLLGITALFADKFALSFPTFGPERRGAPVLGFTKIDNQRIADRSGITDADYRIFLDKTLYDDKKVWDMKSHGFILVNTSEPIVDKNSRYNIIGIDATGLALSILGIPIVNTAMLGALAAVYSETGIDAFTNAIEHDIKPSLVQKNLTLFQKAFTLTKRDLL